MSNHYGGGPDDDFDRGYRAGLQNGGKERDLLRADLAAERERADKAEQELTEWEMADNAVVRTLGADYNAALAVLRVARATMKVLAEAYVDVGLSAGMGSAEIADELAVVNTYAALSQIDKVLNNKGE